MLWSSWGSNIEFSPAAVGAGAFLPEVDQLLPLLDPKALTAKQGCSPGGKENPKPLISVP